MAKQYEEAVLRSAAYHTLSLCFLYPAGDVASVLRGKVRNLASGAFVLPWPDVAVAAFNVATALEDMPTAYLQEAFLAIFGHTVPADCPPYEAEYSQAHIFQKSQTLSDVAGFYQAFDMTPDPNLRDRPDHLSVEMEFMHFLTLKEAHALSQGHGADAVAVCRRAQESFLSGHLHSWIKAFARRVNRKVGSDNPYGPLARLLDAYMDAEFAAFGLTPDLTPTAAILEHQE